MPVGCQPPRLGARNDRGAAAISAAEFGAEPAPMFRRRRWVFRETDGRRGGLFAGRTARRERERSPVRARTAAFAAIRRAYGLFQLTR
jgi:hypothetical protein